MRRQGSLFGGAGEAWAADGPGEVEAHFAALGESCLVGVDEAGRGPLAGPVVAAAVALPAGLQVAGLDDSKRLTASRRERLFDVICAEARAWHIAAVEADEIDRVNILQATLVAMRSVVLAVASTLEGAGQVVHRVVIDGNQLIPFAEAPSWPQTCVVKGDQRSTNVAAASILAKVHRDRLLAALDQQYPRYGFAQHKGYPTEAHREAIAAHGPSPVHRLSFRGVREHLTREPPR